MTNSKFYQKIKFETKRAEKKREKQKMKMQLRWGIIGTGRICQDFCLALLTCSTDEHRIVAVGARTKSQSEKFVQDFSLGDDVRVYGTQEDVYRDENVDIVYIGTIEQVHRKLTVEALENDKHVLCEKPLAMNEDEVKQMIETARRKNKFFMEAIWSRFFPIYDYLRDAVKQIGTVTFVDCTFCVTNLSSTIWSLLMAIGCYPIQAALIAFDHEEPIEVRAVGHTKENEGETSDSMANITLIFKNNRMAVLNCLGENIESINSLTIYGTKGVVRLPDHFWCPTQIFLPNGERKEFPLPSTMKETNFEHSTGLRYEAIACREQILQGQTEHPLMTHEQSLQITRILQSAREQILSKRR